MNMDGKTREEVFFDSFNYKLSSFFHDEYNEIDSIETPATFMIVYEKELKQKEFELFDRLQFRIFYDKEVITGSNPVNVKLLCDNYSAESVMALSKRICDVFGLDDSGICSNADINFYNADDYDLFWTIGDGESFISIERDKKDGLSLNILFYNNLIKQNVGDLLKPERTA
ncbi:MAG: hypothetical protein J6T98_09270 [Salinivirgaceae bacterium]|nr:hypothetical protein [Salinivirgaceae bacterium]